MESRQYSFPLEYNTCEGRKWNCMSGCGTPGPLRMKPPVSRWEELAAPVLLRNHCTPTCQG